MSKKRIKHKLDVKGCHTKEPEEKVNKRKEQSPSSQSDGMKYASFIFIIVHSILVLCVYIYTLYPNIPGGDSGELIVAAHELGVAHPPGYPVFTLLLWLAIKIFRFGNIAWRANLMNALLSGAASCVFTFTIYRYTKNVGISLIGSSLWSFSNLAWTWSTCAEVFSLNNLCVAVLLYVMIVFEQTDENKHVKISYIGSFLCGLSLCNQHTIVVYVLVIAIWVLYDLYKIQVLTVKVLCKITAFFLLGLVPYIYLPLSCILHNARWTWGNQANLHGFFKHLLRMEYGTFSLSSGDRTNNGFFNGLSVCAQHVLTEFTIVGVVLCLIGIIQAFRRRSKSLVVCIIMCIVYILLFSWRANLDVNNKLFLGVVERFWLQSNMILVLMIAIGLSEVFSYIPEFMCNKKSGYIEIIISVIVCAAQIQRNLLACNQRENTVVAEFGSRIFNNVPNGALVLTMGDLPSNVLRYKYICENTRPHQNVIILDMELMTYDWFVPKLREAYRGVTFAGHHMAAKTGMIDGVRVFDLETFLHTNNKRPIICCICTERVDLFYSIGFYLFPYGPCSILRRRGPRVLLDHLKTKGAVNVSAGWNYPESGFDERSWERVATNEMWNAKINLPLKLYEMAMKHKEDDEGYITFMTESYTLYKQAVEKENIDTLPAYWHRNFALASEKMLRMSVDYSKDEILQDTVFHFEQYMKKDPTDESIPIIKDAVKNWKNMYKGQF
ncbi:hypothetical protein ACF0H5_002841 [Mactra antiquata]